MDGIQTHEPNQMAASSFFPPNFLLQMQNNHDHQDEDHHHHQDEDHHHHHQHQQQHLPVSFTSLPDDYQGMAALLGKRSMSLTGLVEQPCEEANGEDDLSDDCSQAGEKKRRLNMEQVRTLEKNFELGNKLEPERKMQLARALGLQPRQVAIWFQNRRARWKTKQLEKDYNVLKKQFEAAKSENDALLAHNKKLQGEMMALNGREILPETINLNKRSDASGGYRSDNSSDVNLETPAFFPLRPPPMGANSLQCPKLEQPPAGVAGQHQETFSNMFCSLDDQAAAAATAGFWTSTTWQEHQGFH